MSKYWTLERNFAIIIGDCLDSYYFWCLCIQTRFYIVFSKIRKPVSSCSEKKCTLFCEFSNDTDADLVC